MRMQLYKSMLEFGASTSTHFLGGGDFLRKAMHVFTSEAEADNSISFRGNCRIGRENGTLGGGPGRHRCMTSPNEATDAATLSTLNFQSYATRLGQGLPSVEATQTGDRRCGPVAKAQSLNLCKAEMPNQSPTSSCPTKNRCSWQGRSSASLSFQHGPHVVSTLGGEGWARDRENTVFVVLCCVGSVPTAGIRDKMTAFSVLGKG